MPRASSILCLPAVLALAGAASAVELPVIVNGAQVAQATKTEVAPAPAGAKTQLPVIINYPSAAFQAAPAGQKTDAKLPVIIANPVKPAPARVAVAYTVPEYVNYMTPVAYNAYGIGSAYGVNDGLGYGMSASYGGGYYGDYGYGGYAIPAYDAYGPWGYGAYPPLVQVLDTGIRANAGRLTSIPGARAPLYGQVIGVYYR
jgi:hypothetical protein